MKFQVLNTIGNGIGGLIEKGEVISHEFFTAVQPLEAAVKRIETLVEKEFLSVLEGDLDELTMKPATIAETKTTPKDIGKKGDKATGKKGAKATGKVPVEPDTNPTQTPSTEPPAGE